MVERLAGIVHAVVDALDIGRGGAEKQKPKSLFLGERYRLEKECAQIVGKEDFGREDFGNFCKNMIVLARQEGDSKGFARLRDWKAELNIDFNENSISMRGNPVATVDPHVFDAGYYQHISYIAQKVEYVVFRGDKSSDFQPILITHDRVPIPSSIEFFSYFRGKPESAFPKGAHYVRKEEKVSDRDVQDFCKRVYSVYTLSKVGL